MQTSDSGGRKRRLVSGAHPTLQPILRRVRFGIHAESNRNATGEKQTRMVNAPLTADSLQHHLNGGPAYGTYPMLPGESVTLISLLDFDSHKGETPWHDLLEKAQQLRGWLLDQGMKPQWFRSSGGKGIHLYLIWDTPQDARAVRIFLQTALAHFDLREGAGGLIRNQVEIFPKQEALTAEGAGSYGNMFVLPLAFKAAPLDDNGRVLAKDYSVEWASSCDVPPAPSEPQHEPVTDVSTDLAVLKSALDTIPNDGSEPSLDYDEWLRFIFALHHDSDGSKEGLALAEEFSRRNPKHENVKELHKQWKFANANRSDAVTGRSILRWARDNHEWRQQLPAELEFTELPDESEARIDDGLDDTVGPLLKKKETLGWCLPKIIDDATWLSAKLAPRCIVEKYLYADVACLVAPGGTGKTTMTLHEAVGIALGRSIWGLRIVDPGPVLIITAEDQAERLVARLRHICAHMGLSNDDIRKVRNRIRIDDCTARPWRLTEIVGDVVQPSEIAYRIADGCERLKYPPALIQFDPLMSFGVGESRVNDAEQALVTAARMLVSRLQCCVRYVHHTGKAVALEKRTDQYSARGGSALSDGARMVAVMQPQTAYEWHQATGTTLEEGDSAFVLARSKLSYTAPQPLIHVKRRMYEFQVIDGRVEQSHVEQLNSDAETILKLVESEALQGRKHSLHGLENIAPEGISRARLRAAVIALVDASKLESRKTFGKKGTPMHLAIPGDLKRGNS